MLKASLTISLYLISCYSFAQFTKVVNQAPVIDGRPSQGAAWVDYDNDGYDDLFVTASYAYGVGGTKSILYHNNHNGTFTEVTDAAMTQIPGVGRNAAWGDYNNDGKIDVFIVNQIETLLYRNDGSNTFTKINTVPTTPSALGPDHSGGTWGDYNNDGWLDLFLSSYKLESTNEPNLLYKNNGDGTFTLQTSSVTAVQGPSQDASWIDFDKNGTLDLFVSNYSQQPSFLYSNKGDGTFVSVSNPNLTTIAFASLGAAWGDMDNDGDFDLFVPRNVNGPNTFYENVNGVFQVANPQNGLQTTKSSSACWADFDNDGYIDLMTTGGDGDKNYLFRNNGDKTFTDVSVSKGITDLSYSWAVAASDYDHDGFLDFFIAASEGNNLDVNDILYHNTPNSNHWISVKAKGIVSNRDGIGVVISANIGDKWQYRTVQSKTGQGSQNSLRAHFGTGASTKVDRLVVEWPLKGFQEMNNVDVDQFVDLTEPAHFPSVPTETKGINKVLEKINISWVDNSSDETGFRIERAVANQAFALIGEVASGVTSFVDNSAKAGTTYQYRVAAKTTGGYSYFSNVVTVISRRAQHMSAFTVIDTKYLDSPPFDLSATITEGGEPSFVVINGGANVSLSNKTLTILHLGTSTIGAYAKESNNFFASDTLKQVLVVNMVTGLEEGVEDGIGIFPNPAFDRLFIQAAVADGADAVLINGTGQVLGSFKLTESEYELSVKDLPQGLYIISIAGKTAKFMKR